MDPKVAMGIIRHILTFAAGVMVSKGWFDAGMAGQISGIVLSIVAVAWSWISKTDVQVPPPDSGA